MVKTKVDDVVEATPVEEVATNEVAPAPSTVDYNANVKLSDKFRSDVVTALSEFAYVETHELIKVVESNEVLPINIVNEVIRRISSFPYRAVAHIMRVVETGQATYFTVEEAAAAESK